MNSNVRVRCHRNDPQRGKFSQQQIAQRRTPLRLGFVFSTSEGTSRSSSVSPTTLIPACSESVVITSSRRSRGRLATKTLMIVSM